MTSTSFAIRLGKFDDRLGPICLNSSLNKSNYTLLELNPERKADKAILIIVIIYIVIVFPFIIAFLIARWLNPGFKLGMASEIYWVELLIAVIIFVFVRYYAYKFFGGNRK